MERVYKNQKNDCFAFLNVWDLNFPSLCSNIIQVRLFNIERELASGENIFFQYKSLAPIYDGIFFQFRMESIKLLVSFLHHELILEFSIVIIVTV